MDALSVELEEERRQNEEIQKQMQFVEALISRMKKMEEQAPAPPRRVKGPRPAHGRTHTARTHTRPPRPLVGGAGSRGLAHHAGRREAAPSARRLRAGSALRLRAMRLRAMLLACWRAPRGA